MSSSPPSKRPVSPRRDVKKRRNLPLTHIHQTLSSSPPSLTPSDFHTLLHHLSTHHSPSLTTSLITYLTACTWSYPNIAAMYSLPPTHRP
ncbi:hypothetical protein HK104_008006, partial [Borealophlyctis nickersoniae]